MSRWGSTQTSAQWNTTTMTRVKVSLKTRFCNFLFSKATVFVPFYGMIIKLPITECLNVQGANTQWTKRKTRKLTAEKGAYPPISISIYPSTYTVKALQRRIPKLTSLPPIQNCHPVSFCFFSFSQFLHLCPVSC